MDASTQKCLIETPTFLFIQLLRFDYHINAKIETTVVPENILVLPNGDRYKLLSIGNHLGTFINNGHYQALVKAGTSWIKADDDKSSKTSLCNEIDGDNYIFLYKKLTFNSFIRFLDTGVDNPKYKKGILTLKKNV